MWTGAGIDVVVPDVGRLVAELIVAVAVVNGCCVIITWTLQYQSCQVLLLLLLLLVLCLLLSLHYHLSASIVD